MAREQVKRAAHDEKAADKKVDAFPLLRDGKAVEKDPWGFLADDEAADQRADIIVSVKRLLDEGEELARRPGRLGVVVRSSEAVEEIASYVPQLSLIAIDFPGYRDGRGFTTARLLRERYHYIGALRAIGDVLQDQVFFMLRCGFDEFVLKAKDSEAAFARASGAFTKVYQPAADGRETVTDLRRGKNS